MADYSILAHPPFVGLIIHPSANNESSEVVDILLPVTFYFNPSTRLDKATNF